VDTAGRVDKFRKRYAGTAAKEAAPSQPSTAKEAAPLEPAPKETAQP
jgi:hypothetical protein